MQPVSTSTSPQAQRLWLGYGLCIIAAVVIWLLMGQYLSSPATDPFAANLDVNFYLREGQQIHDGGLFAFNSAVHAYGYPLFVSLCLTLASVIQQPVMGVVTVVQFLLHLAASGLALTLFKKLYGEEQPAIGARIGVFALVVCNPILLAATYYMLSDSITVFWLMLVLACALSSWRGRWWIVGVALGLCIVTRPYHQIWTLIIVIALLATLSFFRWVQRYSVYLKSGQVGRALVQIVLPLLIIVGTQYVITHEHHGTWSIVGGTGDKAIQIHITGSLYYYRYETLLQPSGFVSGIRYWNEDVRYRIAPLAIEEPSMVALYIEQFRADPASLPMMALVKLVGLFQHYDWRLFLLDAGITAPLALGVGLCVFILFVTIVQTGLLRGIELIRKRPRNLKLTSLVVLFWVVFTYIVLYAVATVPEPRFIFPVFPLITIVGFYLMMQPRPLWQRVSAPMIAALLYVVAALIIVPAAVIG